MSGNRRRSRRNIIRVIYRVMWYRFRTELQPDIRKLRSAFNEPEEKESSFRPSARGTKAAPLSSWRRPVYSPLSGSARSRWTSAISSPPSGRSRPLTDAAAMAGARDIGVGGTPIATATSYSSVTASPANKNDDPSLTVTMGVRLPAVEMLRQYWKHVHHQSDASDVRQRHRGVGSWRPSRCSSGEFSGSPRCRSRRTRSRSRRAGCRNRSTWCSSSIRPAFDEPAQLSNQQRCVARVPDAAGRTLALPIKPGQLRLSDKRQRREPGGRGRADGVPPTGWPARLSRAPGNRSKPSPLRIRLQHQPSS